MANEIHLEDVRRAWAARDPDVVRLICGLADQAEDEREGDAPVREGVAPVREGVPTFEKFLAEIRTKAFHKRPAEEQRHYRVETLKALESPTAEAKLSDRLRLHEVLLEMWADGGPFARQSLLEVVASVKLTYGPWRALKRIFKEAEERGDTEMWGALTARFDAAHGGGGHDVGRLTLAYMARRAWRFLRTG